MCNTMKLYFPLDFSFSVILGNITETHVYIINFIFCWGKYLFLKHLDSLNINHFRMFIKHYFIHEGYIAKANDDGKNYLERWEWFIQAEGW